MNVLMDLGNSRLKWACAQDGAIQQQGAAVYNGHAGIANVLAQCVPDIIQRVRKPARVMVASVARRAANEALTRGLAHYFGHAPDVLRPSAQAYGVTNAYANPARLGADRWAALIGAHYRTRQSVCIIDCGTAITIDALAGDGTHHGGLIAPGLHTMRRALYGETAGIPDEGEGRLAPLATDTRSAVSAGTLYAAAAFIDRAHALFEQQLGTPLPCLITGGEMDVLRPYLQLDAEPAPQLVFEGLAVAAAQA